MRATDMPSNKKMRLPRFSQTVQEMEIQVLKSDMTKTIERYSKENKNKWANLTSEEKKGLKSVLERKKNREIVTNTTDKSGRFAVDSVENYVSLNEVHVSKDKIINSEEYGKLVKEMNGHSTCWCKFLNVGKETGQEDRIRHNFENENHR